MFAAGKYTSGRVLDRRKRFEGRAALPLRLQGEPQVSLGSVQIFAHVQRGSSCEFMEDCFKRLRKPPMQIQRMPMNEQSEWGIPHIAILTHFEYASLGRYLGALPGRRWKRRVSRPEEDLESVCASSRILASNRRRLRFPFARELLQLRPSIAPAFQLGTSIFSGAAQTRLHCGSRDVHESKVFDYLRAPIGKSDVRWRPLAHEPKRPRY